MRVELVARPMNLSISARAEGGFAHARISPGDCNGDLFGEDFPNPLPGGPKAHATRDCRAGDRARVRADGAGRRHVRIRTIRVVGLDAAASIGLPAAVELAVA